MQFSQVFGLDHLKKKLIANIQNNRLPHAQLFLGAARIWKTWFSISSNTIPLLF